MSKSSGGVRINSNSSGTGSTEKEMSKELAKAVLAKEEEIRNSEKEYLCFFDKDGNETLTLIGNKGSVIYVGHEDKIKNSILTHNHPSDRSFSWDDIDTALSYNAAEIRAVGAKNTYSLKRPKNGWGVSATKAKEVFISANKSVLNQQQKWLDKNGRTQANLDKASADHIDKVIKKMSKVLGWNYTTKKRK